MQVDPVNPKLKPPGTKHLKVKCNTLLSTFAFKFDSRRYNKVLKMEIRARFAGLEKLGATMEARAGEGDKQLAAGRVEAAQATRSVEVGPGGICRHYFRHNRQIGYKRIIGHNSSIIG